MTAATAADTTIDRSAKVAAQFLALLEQKDTDRLGALWTPDGVFELPFAPYATAGNPVQVRGQRAIHDFFVKACATKNFSFHDIVLHPMRDPNEVFVEFKGDLDILPTGVRYTDTYCALARADGDRLALWREYFHAIIREQNEGAAI